ncbi:MAG TPA: hypothetical protein EYP04_10570 [Anaerolineae bacterium]|nr:hypothetical protein [Anaerolineae bacterium]HIQ05861.1 hypothetical protein [Anaerolineae bacterium]
MELPLAFLARMARLLGDEYPTFLASYDNSPLVGLRVNTLKLTPETFRRLAPFDLTSVPWCPEGFTVPDDQRPGGHPYHAAGLYYLHDPAAMAVGTLLAPQPGERVLDLCAAPGGKATQLAALLQNEGLLVANDVDSRRARVLAENLERWGARNVVILSERPERLASRWPDCFDRVLVDAPCSGEGMFRKSEAARQEWKPTLVAGSARRQQAILDAAAQLVRPGGWLVYVTCTFAPEENEGAIAHFLVHHANFELVPPAWYPGFSPGRPDWLADLPPDFDADLRQTVRLWPHRAPAEGHFIALLRRLDGDLRRRCPSVRLSRPPTPIRRLYDEFCARYLTAPPSTNLVLVDTKLYHCPADVPDLSGLRVLRPGWWLGTVRKARFEPAHALAMALTAVDVRQTLSLSTTDFWIHAYLRGETLASPGDDGWVLVTVDGYPLGWGKRVSGVVKNRYPKGIRRRG